MDRTHRSVKPPRPYDSTRRRKQAMQTQQEILDSARRLLLRDGFTATTLAAVAEDARVSVATVYKAFGSKAGLVRAIAREALAGDGPVPAEARSDAMQATETDPREIIRRWGTLTTEIAPRIAPILLLVAAAAALDPEMARLSSELEADRFERMSHNALTLTAAGHLREELTAHTAAEVLWTYSSPELYELLVLKRRWPLERYGTFIADAMIAALLPPRSTGPQARRVR